MNPHVSNAITDLHQKVFKRHVESTHEFACNQCDFKLTSKAHLKGHIETTHEFACEQCDYKSPSTTHLKRHNETAHKTKRLSCNICKRKFNKSEIYEKHKKSAHTENLVQTVIPFQRILRSNKKAASSLESIN